VVAWAALVRLADWARQRRAALPPGGSPCPAEFGPLSPPAHAGPPDAAPARHLADAAAGPAAAGAAGPQPDDRRAGHAATPRRGGDR
jgi:hypothetical protein